MAETTPQSGGTGGKAAAADNTPRYSRDELPEFLGQPPHVLAGALEGESKPSFTLAEAQKLVDKFLKHEDTSEGAQPDENETEE